MEYPWRHRFAAVLRRSPVAHPVEPADLEAVIAIADGLAEEREAAFYGTGEGPASQLFGEGDAQESLRDARRVLEFVSRLMGG